MRTQLVDNLWTDLLQLVCRLVTTCAFLRVYSGNVSSRLLHLLHKHMLQIEQEVVDRLGMLYQSYLQLTAICIRTQLNLLKGLHRPPYNSCLSTVTLEGCVRHFSNDIGRECSTKLLRNANRKSLKWQYRVNSCKPWFSTGSFAPVSCERGS